MVRVDISTKRRSEFIDITGRVQSALSASKLKKGLCVVFCPHTTAGLTINENADPSVRKDILTHLSESIPEGRGYSHLEGNADSHIKSTLVGSSLTILVEEGALLLGTWQGVYFCEFDGPRQRQIYIKVIEG